MEFMPSRPKLQRTKTGFLVQPVHPVTGRRVRITGRSEGEVWARYEQLLKTRSELRNNLVAPAEAAAVAARAIAGGPISVKFVWDRHVATLSETWGPKARAYWHRHLAPEFAERRAWELSQTIVETWLARLRLKVKPKTALNVYNVLAAAMRRAVADRMLPALPWGDWRPRAERWELEREAATSPEELHALVLAALEHDMKAWKAGRFSDLTMRIAVIALCGLRNGEAAGLGWDAVSIDAEPAMLAVRCQAAPGWRRRHPEWTRPEDPPKFGKRRTIRLHPSAVAALRVQRERLRAMGWYRHDGPVFPISTPAPGAWRSNPKCIQPEDFREIVSACGLPNVSRWTTHSLRHSFATLELHASGNDLRAVQARTGHGSLRVLEKYIHARSRNLGSSAIPALAPELMTIMGASAEPLALPEARTRYRPEDAAELARDASLLAMSRTEGPIIDTLAVTEEEARAVDDARATAKHRDRLKTRKQWAVDVAGMQPLARRWLTEGGDGGARPTEVTKGAQLAYVRGYSQSIRETPGARDLARAEGKKARAAYLLKWSQALGMARKRLAGGGVPALPAHEPAGDGG